MIVTDTSALISLATMDVLPIVLDEFDIHTTTAVQAELTETASYDDVDAKAAQRVLDTGDHITVHETTAMLESSRIDHGEGTCLQLVQEEGADFLITDDLRALPELNATTDATVALSPIVLRALVKRDAIENDDAMNYLDQIAENRDWLGAPIYRYARDLFES